MEMIDKVEEELHKLEREKVKQQWRGEQEHRHLHET